MYSQKKSIEMEEQTVRRNSHIFNFDYDYEHEHEHEARARSTRSAEEPG